MEDIIREVNSVLNSVEYYGSEGRRIFIRSGENFLNGSIYIVEDVIVI